MILKSIQHYSRYSDKAPSKAERVIRTIESFLKKPKFEKGNADWLSELSSVVKKHKDIIHNSTKMTHIQTSKKSNEKVVYNNLRDRREKQKQNFKLGDLVKTSDIRSVFSNRDSTNYCYEIYTIAEVLHDTIPSNRINYLPERYNHNLLLPTKVTLDDNNQIMKI